MDEHPNATILRDLAERMSSGDMEAAMSVLADDVEWHEIGRAEPTRGKEALAQRYAESVGDFQIRRPPTTSSPTTSTRSSCWTSPPGAATGRWSTGRPRSTT